MILVMIKQKSLGRFIYVGVDIWVGFEEAIW